MAYTYNKFLLISNQIIPDETYDVELESLADYWVGWNLADEIARIRCFREFQPQRILAASAAENVNGNSFQLINWFNLVNEHQILPSSQLQSTYIHIW